MDDQTRKLPPSDRAVALTIVALAGLLGVVAPLMAAPWALVDGALSLRFFFLVATTVAAWWLGAPVALRLLARLREA